MRKSCLLPALVAVVVASGACAHHGPPPRYPGAIGRPLPSSRERSPEAPTAAARAVVELVLSLQGTPYRNGGAGEGGFDCSGLVRYVFERQQVALPRSVREQWDAGEPVDRDALAPGDLVFFETVARGPSHVGIVVGEDVFVHAPSGRGVVRADRLSAAYWNTRYVGARRIVPRE